MTAATVVCIGIATLDAIALVERLPGPGERMPAREARVSGGGVAATAAVTLARLGVPVAFIGRVGDDDAGRFVAAGLEAAGVDTSRLRVVEGRTPVTVVLVEAGTGERTLVPDTRGVPPLALTDGDVESAAGAAWVHVDQTGHPAIGRVRGAGLRTPVSFDGGNVDSDLSLAGVDLYAPTAAALLARHPGSALEDAIEAALDEGPRLVVVTVGRDGSLAAERDAAGNVQVTTAGSFDVPIVSTLGAGDVFHGALLAGLAEGRDMGTALQMANAAAGLACRALDGRSAIPNRAELDTFLAHGSQDPEVSHAR